MSGSVTVISVKPAETVAVLSTMLLPAKGVILVGDEAEASLGAAIIGKPLSASPLLPLTGEISIGGVGTSRCAPTLLRVPGGRGEMREPVG